MIYRTPLFTDKLTRYNYDLRNFTVAIVFCRHPIILHTLTLFKWIIETKFAANTGLVYYSFPPPPTFFSTTKLQNRYRRGAYGIQVVSLGLQLQQKMETSRNINEVRDKGWQKDVHARAPLLLSYLSNFIVLYKKTKSRFLSFTAYSGEKHLA